MFLYLSHLTGIPLDQISTCLILTLISPVLAYLSLRVLPSPVRPFFNIATGVWFLQIVVGDT